MLVPPFQQHSQLRQKGWNRVKRTLLPAGPLDLLGGANADKAVVRLELLQGLVRVIDEGEAGALAATVLRAEAENGDLVLVDLVHVGELAAELILGDVGAVGVEDIPARREGALSESGIL